MNIVALFKVPQPGIAYLYIVAYLKVPFATPRHNYNVWTNLPLQSIYINQTN